MTDSPEQKQHKGKRHKEHKKHKRENKEKKEKKHKRHKHHQEEQPTTVAAAATPASVELPSTTTHGAAPPTLQATAAAANAGHASQPASEGEASRRLLTPTEVQEHVKHVLFGADLPQDMPRVELPSELQEEYEAVEPDSDDCAIDIRPVIAKEEEVWAIKLPEGVDLATLHGCVMHLPCELPEARHVKPPKDILSGRYDLLAYVKAALKPMPIGHLQLDPQQAHGVGLHAFRELHQESEQVAARLRCAAPVSDNGQHKIRSVRVARVISISDDVVALSKRAVAAAVSEGPTLWGDEDGWDGQLPQRKRRKRVAGWDVIGEQPHKAQQRTPSEDEDPFVTEASSSGSDSDEEFDEVVFLPQKAVPILKDDQEKQRRQEEEQKASGYGPEQIQQELLQQLTDDLHDTVDWEERQYDPGWEDPLQQQQQQPPGTSSQPEADAEPIDADLLQFLLSLPVRPDVAARQAAHTRHLATLNENQQPQQDWEPTTASMQREAGGSGQKTPSPQHQQPYSDDHDDAFEDGSDGVPAPDKWEYSPVTPSPAGQTPTGDTAGVGPSGEALVAGEQGHEEQEDTAGDEEMPPTPPRPIPMLLAHMEEFEPVLESLADGDRSLFIRMRNKLIKQTLEWEELCEQIDMDAMHDSDLPMLVSVLEEQRRHIESGSAKDLQDAAVQHTRDQSARLLLPSEGPAPRPGFKQVDQGYPPYQARDEGREDVVIPQPSPNWEIADSDLAEQLVQQGAGRLHRFVTTQELRGKGFEWDSDPEDECREGLVIGLPDGRSMHVPSGLHYDLD